MGSLLTPRASVLLLVVIAVVFGSNHVAARLAFDHGTSVATAVAVRSGITALALLVWLRAIGVGIALPRTTLARACLIGALVALQSFCLYSSVARIPAALALLAFNTYPMLLALLTWASGGGRPSAKALVAMPVALAGLVLALDVVGHAGDLRGRWEEIGVGVGWALGAAATFTLVLFLTGRWMKEVDGRLRSFYAMGVTALLVGAAGATTDAFALPQDGLGWLGLALLTLLYGSAFTALFVVLPRLPAAHLTVTLNIEPIAVLAIAWALLGQSVSALQILGALIVIGAITFPVLRR